MSQDLLVLVDQRWKEVSNDWLNQFEELKTKRKAGDVKVQRYIILYSENKSLNYKRLAELSARLAEYYPKLPTIIQNHQTKKI